MYNVLLGYSMRVRIFGAFTKRYTDLGEAPI